MSVTLDADNVQWLKGRARITHSNNVSLLLDSLVTEARRARGSVGNRPFPSVVGMVDLSDDPNLEQFDAARRQLWDAHLEKVLLMEDPSPSSQKPRRRKRG